jgi:hypothetical protein
MLALEKREMNAGEGQAVSAPLPRLHVPEVDEGAEAVRVRRALEASLPGP